jgi:tetratricopeptide (TPR) repeat protein
MARAVGAFPEAERFVAQAEQLAPDDPELAMERGENAAWHGDHEGTAAALRDATAALGPGADPRTLAELHLRFADWHVIPMCRPHVAADAARRALSLLEGGGGAHTVLHRRVCSSLAWCEAVAGDPARAEALLDDLEAQARREADDDAALADRERARVVALTRRGAFRETYEVARRGGEAAVRAGRADLAYHLYGNAAGSAACAGDLDVAMELLDRLSVAMDGAGMPAVEGSALLARCWVLHRAGRLDEARVAAQTARRVAERIGSPALQAEADHELARAALAGGDPAAAEELFAAALAVPDAKLSRPLARLWRAEALTQLGRTEDAETELRGVVLEPVRPGDWPDTLVARMARAQGLVAAARGDHALARRRLDEAAAGWRRRLGDTNGGDRWAAALADIGRPVLGVVEPAVELARVEAELASLGGRVTESEEAPIA